MAVAVDITTTSITTGFAAGPVTKTWTHTCTGSNLVLVLCADIWQDVGGTGTITAATYNGVSFTHIAQVPRSVSMTAEMWYLIAPATGANTVSVTVTGATDAIKMATTSLSGVNQTTALDTSNSANGTTGNPTMSLTTATANVGVIGTLSRFSTTAATTSDTPLYNNSTASILGASDYQLATSVGSYSDTYTGTASQDWAMIMAGFIPSSGAATVIHNLSILGVGA